MRKKKRKGDRQREGDINREYVIERERMRGNEIERERM